MTLLNDADVELVHDRAELDRLADRILAMDGPVRTQWFLELPDSQLDVVSHALGGRNIGWRADPAQMAMHLEPGRWKPWRYVTLLGQQFRKAVTGESKRQIINIQSRYGKSMWLARWGPAWAYDYDPTLNLILSSYGDELAMENAYAVRDILRDHAGRLRVELRQDRQKIDRFMTTEGGGLLAAGINSAISGFPGDGIILDDPFKNWQEAHSETNRNRVENQYRAVLRMRAETEDAFIILCHNRWHEDDLTGRFVKQMEDGTGEQWEWIRLPTVAEAHDPNAAALIDRLPDPLGRSPGELLEPERFSAAATDDQRRAIGSFLSSAMMLQRPTAEEGTDVKRAWFALEDRMPDRADEWLSSWDMKLKDKESGDYVVGQLWARTGKDCWLMEQLRGQWNFVTTVNAIALMAVRWPQCAKHVIENTGNAPEVMAALKTAEKDYRVSDDVAGQLAMTTVERALVDQLRQRGMAGLSPNNVTEGNKRVRMRAVSPYIESGDTHLPSYASWLIAYLDEMAAFPNGTHDDQVDATSQALAKLHGHGARTGRKKPDQRATTATTV